MPTQLELRQCTKCGQWLPLSEFHRRAQSKSGYTQACKWCKAVILAEYRRRKSQEAPPSGKQSNRAHGEQLRTLLLDYLQQRLGDGTLPSRFTDIAGELRLTTYTVSYHIRQLQMEGRLTYRRGRGGFSDLVLVDTAPVLGSRCRRCGVLSTHLNPTGYCCMCQIELAYGKPYRPGMAGIRVRVEGMFEPAEPSDSIAVSNWPTRGVLVTQEVRL